MRALIITVLAITSLTTAKNALPASEFAVGADLSYLKQAEDRGTVFKNGTPRQCPRREHLHDGNVLGNRPAHGKDRVKALDLGASEFISGSVFKAVT